VQVGVAFEDPHHHSIGVIEVASWPSTFEPISYLLKSSGKSSWREGNEWIDLPVLQRRARPKAWQ
jgi:hypothetical protein